MGYHPFHASLRLRSRLIRGSGLCGEAARVHDPTPCDWLKTLCMPIGTASHANAQSQADRRKEWPSEAAPYHWFKSWRMSLRSCRAGVLGRSGRHSIRLFVFGEPLSLSCRT